MSRRRDTTAWALAAFPVAALALLRLAPTPPPRSPLDPALAFPLGLLVGAFLFLGLAGRVWRRAFHPAALGAGVSLAAAGASEEAIWRGFALARAAAGLGVAGALAVTTVGFAAAHFPALRLRGVRVHLGTGTAFGVLFATSGSLTACATAHALYNLLALVYREPAPVAFAAAGSAPVAELRTVEKRFGPVTALRGVDLAFAEGRIAALLGPNGAGKTTLVSLLLGLRRPDRGTVRLFGRDPRRWRARIHLGVTPQEMSFPPTLRVREILDFARAHYPTPARRDELLADFGLADLAGRQVGGLSAGQRRRLAVALAFAGRPRLVILDEPTTGLDVESRHGVWEGIRRYAATGGTVLLTTHYLEEAEALADRIVVLHEGAVVADGTAAAVRAAASDAGTLESAFLQLTRGSA